MSSWVRYSVAVYLGLLMAGTLMPPQMAESAQPQTPALDHLPLHSEQWVEGDVVPQGPDCQSDALR